MGFNAEDAENVERMTQKDLAAFSRNMKKIREQLNMTQLMISNESGIYLNTWSRIERGHAEKVNFQALEMIAYTLGMTVGEILTEGEED